ncbi:MAG: bifunctional (p)ppGpp synthetase/guanosine-3',5'-bis(diphosphate) 3'-pyrophosphohydrolase [Pseudomonadota bacterium]
MMRQVELVERVQAYDPAADEALLNRAYVYAMKAHSHQRRASGDPYFSHPLEVAAILTDLRLDDATIATALLHDVIEDTEATRAEIDSLFGPQIGALVDGLTKIKRLDLATQKVEQAENFRKLLLAISSDIRVLLVKFADRLHNMRTLTHMRPEKQKRISAETLEIYAPLAGRMGMQALREELEDLSFRWLHPDAYTAVSDQLEMLAEGNQGLVEDITEALSAQFENLGISATISGRAKRPYSIWNKMKNRQISLEQLSDIYGFRVIVQDVPTCYRVVGVVHTRWSAVPGRFKDYISTPKQNDYRSIHTTVIGPRHQRVELQIRTHEMHQVAEYGIAAHSAYAETKSAGAAGNVRALDADNGPYIRLRRLVETLLEGNSPQEFLEHTKLELFQDQVFCFTPKGRLIALPRGANPIDFAYAVHTDVGHETVGAIINGRKMPLTSRLANGDEVEILTEPDRAPPAAWEAVAVTGRARAAIRRATRDALRQQYVELGRQLLDARLREAGATYDEAELDEALSGLGFETRDDALTAIGRDELSLEDALKALKPDAGPRMAPTRYRPRNRYDHGQGQEGWFNLAKVMGLKFRASGSLPDSSRSNTPLPIRGVGDDLPVTYQDGGAVPGDRIVGVLVPNEGIKIFQIHWASS